MSGEPLGGELQDMLETAEAEAAGAIIGWTLGKGAPVQWTEVLTEALRQAVRVAFDHGRRAQLITAGPTREQVESMLGNRTASYLAGYGRQPRQLGDFKLACRTCDAPMTTDRPPSLNGEAVHVGAACAEPTPERVTGWSDRNRPLWALVSEDREPPTRPWWADNGGEPRRLRLVPPPDDRR